MTSFDAAALARYVAALSGLFLVVLGSWVALQSRRSARAITFAVFAILWGVTVIFGNLSEVAPTPQLAQRETLLFLAGYVLVYAPLVYFAALAVPGRGRVARNLPAALVMLAPAAIGAALLLVRPDLLTTATGPGPAFPWFLALFFVAFIWAILTLERARLLAASAIESRQLALLASALLVFFTYSSFENALLFAPLVTRAQSLDASLDLAFFAPSIAGVVLSTAIFVRRARQKSPLGLRADAALFGLPAFFGALSGFTLAVPVGFTLDTIGLFRTASVVLIAYAILRYELFDLDAKVKRGAIVAGILVLAALVAMGIEQGLERAVGSTGLAITITQFALVGAVVAVVMKAPAAARALGGRVLPALDAPDRLDARRLEVYEAALAQAAASPGGVEASAPFFADLRARLGVSDAEHALLARLVVPTARARAQAPAFDAGALVAGRYRLERLLGEGSAGAAWLAKDETLARRVVVKTLHARLVRSEEATRAFLREARVAASLDHENVVRVFDFGTSGDTPFLVMEFVDGGSLEERLAAGQALAPELARGVVGGILAGLAHVHARGVLHRDLKPANVLLAADGTPKITDFGVALAATVAGDAAHETQTGLEPAPLPKGTLATMSPEAVRGLPLSPASDVYGVGAILYRCATGRPYLRLEGRSRESARAAILTEPPLPVPPGAAPADLVRVALRALEKDPSRRYHSADEMREALEAQLVVSV